MWEDGWGCTCMCPFMWRGLHMSLSVCNEVRGQLQVSFLRPFLLYDLGSLIGPAPCQVSRLAAKEASWNMPASISTLTTTGITGLQVHAVATPRFSSGLWRLQTHVLIFVRPMPHPLLHTALLILQFKFYWRKMAPFDLFQGACASYCIYSVEWGH